MRCHEPSRAVGAQPERPHQLVGRDAFLAGGHQEEAQRPLGQGDMAAFHDAAGPDRERPVTGVAVDQAGPVGFAVQTVNPLSFAAVGAEWAVGPRQGLEIGQRLGFVMEDRIIEVHGCISRLMQ